MSVHEVEVGIALERPPTTQEIRKYMIEAPSEWDALLIAAQWAYCDPRVSMPVYTELVL